MFLREPVSHVDSITNTACDWPGAVRRQEWNMRVKNDDSRRTKRRVDGIKEEKTPQLLNSIPFNYSGGQSLVV